ncbi:hypothetical protein [Duganella sp. P38]|uniref:hypothetical protein n=1 Tax=Duganella sp. P38 TaxID=3423949 RepID=UPI003D79DB98
MRYVLENDAMWGCCFYETQLFSYTDPIASAKPILLYRNFPAGRPANGLDLAYHVGLGEFDKSGVVDGGGGHGDLRGIALQAIRA